MLIAAAMVFVFLLWALSTAAIFYLDSLPPRTFKFSFGAATLMLAASLWLAWSLRAETSSAALAASFAAGLCAWGWTEMALYMGYITGPRKQRCPPGCAGMSHFGHAVAANLWHELAVIAVASAIWLCGNETALWCFVMLWLMHLSARLNVFLGVRNISAEFVPPHMEALKGFLRQRAMNALFPFSCLALLALIFLIARAPLSFASAMALALAAIGLLEHVLLMLPLPIEKLWLWSLSRPSAAMAKTGVKPDYTIGVPL
jgi:putative photosynthetic complex assembly protein 2